MPKNLYFVDSIYIPIQENGFSTVTLLPTGNQEAGMGEAPLTLQNVSNQAMGMYNHVGQIREGWYVYYGTKDGVVQFGYGNQNSYARERFREFNTLRGLATANYISVGDERAVLPASFEREDGVKVTSYHINVGHGNCSVILIESGAFYQIWMVDCSVVDKTEKWKSYVDNLDDCLKEIRIRLEKTENEKLKIDRFFLTHLHHDHYNGLEYLIDHKYIDCGTLCYVNLYYHMASPSYLRILRKLLNAKVKFIEPVAMNSNNTVRFLHPECRIYRSKATMVDVPEKKRIVGKPVNDSSAVVFLKLGGKTMVFSGDLEQNGFKAMSGEGTCSPYLFASDFYVISHHGSINGHPDMDCCKKKRPIPNIMDCVTKRKNKVLLMGRSGAYSGIYSVQVENYWNGLGNLVYTEKDATGKAVKFVELNWKNGTVVYH